jgi:hypothetical protein
MHAHDAPADPPGLGVPAHVIADAERPWHGPAP